MVGSRGGTGTSAEEGKVLDGGLSEQKSQSVISHFIKYGPSVSKQVHGE